MSRAGGVTFRVAPGGHLHGRVRVPGDKSISHRAVMLGSIAEGDTEVYGFLAGEDTRATGAAFRAMGVSIEERDPTTLLIRGVGMHGLKEALQPLDLGNSGTSLRLLAGLLAGQSFPTVLTGDASLSRRPMRRVAEPLQRMGARITCSAAGTPPVRLEGGARLTGIEYATPVASAQVKSCLLLAGLYAEGRTCVREPGPSRDHTERMLAAFGYPIERDGARVCVTGGGSLRGTRVDIPADLSSAAFFLVGAAVTPGAEVTLEAVGVNPTRNGVIEVLRRMGADIRSGAERWLGSEPVADLTVRGGAPLRGIDIPQDLVPLAIDEFPALFIAAAAAQGRTTLTGAEELRVKESDRLQTMADGLGRLGIEATPTPDGIVIQGGNIRGGEVDSLGDHRIAMAFAMAGLRADGPIVIRDCANVDTSFPGFVPLARSAGLRIGADHDA